MRYLDSYGYIFRSPDWGTNVLLGGLCQLIPIVGPIVMWGYQFEIIDSLLRQSEAIYPKFDFNRFVDYLKRGVWPFLVGLILGAIMMPVMIVLQVMMSAGMAAVGAAAENDSDGAAIAIMVVVMGVFFLAIMVLTTLMWFITVPMALRAGLSQDIGESFRLAWIKDFVSRVWKEQLLSALFLSVTSFVVVMVGLALCCVGVYPAVAVIMFAQAHIYYQLYSLFLRRGGAPVALSATATGISTSGGATGGPT